MRLLLTLITALMLLLWGNAVYAQVGDASHCRPLEALEDTRHYIDCIDAARREALEALSYTNADGSHLWQQGTTHPDANPDLPNAGLKVETDEEGNKYVPYTVDPAEPYQRYENYEGRRRRMAYVRYRRNTYSLFETPPSEWTERTLDWCYGDQASEGICEYRVAFRRREDGTWERTALSHSDEASELKAWQTIVAVTESDWKTGLFDDRHPSTPAVQLGSHLEARFNGDCVSLIVQREGGLRTELPRRCIR